MARLVRFCNRFAVLLQFLGACVVYFLMEWMSRHSLEEAWAYMTGKPLVFLFNALIIFTTTSIVFLFRRRVFVRVLIYVFWLLMGAFNGIILSSRVTPFTGPDLKLAGDALKVAKNYITPFVMIAAVVLVAVIVVVLVMLFRKAPRWQGRRRLVLTLVLIGVNAAAAFGAEQIALNTRLISNYFGNIAFAYNDYGYPYCFLVTLFDTGISQPKGYSEKMIAGIEQGVDAAEIEIEEAEIEGSRAAGADNLTAEPNLVFIQLESFMDPELVEFLYLSEDPIPYFRELMQQYSSGYLRVPVVGAGTINTEFECITGMSLHYFGAGEYPYKTILQEQPCESVPYVLQNRGYATHVVHNNEANFYTRRDVFANLGFQTFTSEEYMPDIEDTTETGWVKDHYLTDEILKCLDSTEGRDYIYTISVQGHGDYPTEPVVTDPPITVTGAEGRLQNNYSWEYYCKQIREMDEFVRQLTDRLSEYPEPVVLVMYGDHLPTMGLEVKDLSNRYIYQTPYVIWDNFGMEKKDENLASYQIASEVLNRIQMHEGTLVRYHQARRNTQNYQGDLEALQYDMLYGGQYVYGGSCPYETKEVQMGIDPIVLNRVEQMSDGSWMFYGENFTASSRVEIDEKMQDETVFISTGQLYLPAEEIAPDAMVDIAQQSNSSQTAGKLLTRTEERPFSSYLQRGAAGED
ncbi:MAG: LTA synthase family protein [Eubacterium sp.]|nr:LTA synthase family protein [Eubacterium sp.]